ncbi:membrane integrity-associated transporter subunit PqiC [bacterium]|nr:membrane integrity-associated transporter subunit PqiC [bacterium]
MKKLFFLLILLMLFSAGCSLLSTDKKKKHYYQIYYQARQMTAQSVDVSVYVRTVDVNRLYKRSNLVYRDSAFELFYYFYHYWAVRPQDMLADVLYHHLKTSNLVSIPLAELDRTPTYTIVSRLVALDEIDSEDQWFARIAMNFSLVDSKTSDVVVSHTFDERREVKNHEPVYIVRAHSAILEKETEIFLRKMEAFLHNSVDETTAIDDASSNDYTEQPLEEAVEEE